MQDRPAVTVAVILRKRRTASRWQPWQWELEDVVPHEDAFGADARCLYRGGDGERWLHPGFRVELFRDDAEGYHLNVVSPAPCWFVLWRIDEEASVAPEPIARPVLVTLSYHEAARFLDAQETVEQVPAPPDIVEWVRAFAEAHHVVEPRKRKRPESFRRLEDRFGQPASVSTDKGDANG
jgi:hypothetical protein